MNEEENVPQQTQQEMQPDNSQQSIDQVQTTDQYTQQTKSPLTYLPFLLLLLVLLGGLFYYGIQTQKEDPSQQINASNQQPSTSQKKTIDQKKTDWKTFTDKEKRFTFQYPDTWEVRNEIYTEAGELSLYQTAFVNEKGTDPYTKGVVIGVYPELGELSLQEFLQTKWYTPPEFTPDVAAAFISNTRIVPATKELPYEQCEELFLQNGIAGYAVWRKNDNDGIFIIAKNMYYPSFTSKDDAFRQILASFKPL